MEDIIKKLKDDDIVITEYSYRLELLEKLNKQEGFLNIKFMDKKSFLSKYYFSYDENAVYYLIDKYKINEDTARIYLNNIIYMQDQNYKNDKLNHLVSIKKELLSNNLLLFDKLFKNSLKRHRIVFYKYNGFTKLELNMIEELKTFTEVLIIDKKYKKYIPKVYEFNTIFEEVEFIAVSILKLIEKKVSISDIKLTNISSEYSSVIDYIFTLHNLKTDINEDYLISNSIAKDFLNKEGNLTEKIEYIKNKYNSFIVEQIIGICNKYISFLNNDIVIEMIKNEFKKTTIKKENYSNTIEIIDYKNYNTDNKYIFFLGCNTAVPITYKDEEYISDNIKEDLLIDKTTEKNKKERQITINNILNIKNLIITYKLNSFFETYYPSSIISDLGLEVIKNYKHDEIYSEDYSSIILAKEIDNFVKYNIMSQTLKNYNSTIKTSYNTYDNSFTGIDTNKLLDYLKDGFNLSYSSMDNYYKCSFKYYINNVLKLNIYEDTFDTYIGSLFHYVLEKGLLKEKNVKDLIKEFINENDRVLSKKEKIFINNLESDIEFTLNTIKDNMKYMALDNYLFEENIKIIKNDKVSITFTGFIDKIMYKKNNDATIVVIVDYKTGDTKVGLNYLNYGLNMQLPVYLYLAKHSKKIDNIVFGGFYLQKILPKKHTIDLKKSNEEKKKEELRLLGYSNSDFDILKEVDKCYDDSKIISGLKLTSKNNFYHYSKILNNNQIENIINLVDKKIDNAIGSIISAKFDINPKVTDKENLGCKFCKFKDICYKTKKDEERITPDNELSFLGGDLNA